VGLNRVRHRVTQFFRTLGAAFLPVDETAAARYLTSNQLVLFRRMARAEQRHGIAVCQALESQGYQDRELLTAALLHDVGKVVAPPWLWERVMVVLAEWLLPAQAARWSEGAPRGLRRGFVTRRYHPAWGAELALKAGVSARAAGWIARHNDPPGEDALLAALQQVDES